MEMQSYYDDTASQRAPGGTLTRAKVHSGQDAKKVDTKKRKAKKPVKQNMEKNTYREKRKNGTRMDQSWYWHKH